MQIFISCAVLLSSMVLYADVAPQDVYFAPFESFSALSTEVRFDGITSHAEVSCGRWAFISRQGGFDTTERWVTRLDQYVKFSHNWFIKFGIAGHTHIAWCNPHSKETLARTTFEIGKFWPGYGAIRFGYMHRGFGVGLDGWIIYQPRFKWLMSLDIATRARRYEAHQLRGFTLSTYHHKEIHTTMQWLNRFFVRRNFFVSAGLEMHGISSAPHSYHSQGFIGFGLSF